MSVIDREARRQARKRQNLVILIATVLAVLATAAAVNAMTRDASQPDPAPTARSVQVQDLPAMTAEECAAAAQAAGWSGTWGAGSDGCWLIYPDGSRLHIGTWKE